MQVRSDWFLPICTGAERLKDESGRKAHPTQKPEALLQRVCWPPPTPAIWCSIRFSAPGPPGSLRGASAVVHRHRARLGLRRSGARRIDAVEPLPEAALALAPTRRSEPRVAFSSVVEAGLARPANGWSTPGGRYSALVRADGALAAGPAVGSIHKIGALVQGLPACNGWTFWHIERDGRLTPIDELRAAMRAAMREAAE